jgi:Cysteine-rich CWC
MPTHETKSCPHCQQAFECRTGDIIHCQCESVKLKQAHRDYIAKMYDDCLCSNCLIKLRSEYNTLQFNQKIKELIANK